MRVALEPAWHAGAQPVPRRNAPARLGLVKPQRAAQQQGVVVLSGGLHAKENLSPLLHTAAKFSAAMPNVGLAARLLRRSHGSWMHV